MAAEMTDAKHPDDVHPEYSLATAYTADGEVYDYIANPETAQTMANEGYRIVIHRGEGRRTKDELQQLVDDELAAAIDCFGSQHRK